MATKDDLVKYTNQFFDAHWKAQEQPPEWDFSWQWKGAVPNYQYGGVYALFRSEELIYIGLGNSRGTVRYAECGISRRLMSHVYVIAPDGSDVNYVPRERWDKNHAAIDLIATLGFSEFSYLSPALEDYLIGKINPPENSMKREKGKSN